MARRLKVCSRTSTSTTPNAAPCLLELLRREKPGHSLRLGTAAEVRRRGPGFGTVSFALAVVELDSPVRAALYMHAAAPRDPVPAPVLRLPHHRGPDRRRRNSASIAGAPPGSSRGTAPTAKLRRTPGRDRRGTRGRPEPVVLCGDFNAPVVVRVPRPAFRHLRGCGMAARGIGFKATWPRGETRSSRSVDPCWSRRRSAVQDFPGTARQSASITSVLIGDQRAASRRGVRARLSVGGCVLGRAGFPRSCLGSRFDAAACGLHLAERDSYSVFAIS